MLIGVSFKTDLKQVFRDPLIGSIVIFLTLLVISFRWLVPLFQRYLLSQYEFDLTPFYPLLMSCICILVALIIGNVYGFLLLDQKDDRTLTAMRVLPVSLGVYLSQRLSLPLLLCMLLCLFCLNFVGVTELSPVQQLFVSIACLPFFLVFTFFLVSFAQNKVQGFALSKAGGVMLWIPAVAYFINEPWQWLFGIIPSYWPAKYFWLAEQGVEGANGIWLLGILIQGLWIRWLYRRFIRAC